MNRHCLLQTFKIQQSIRLLESFISGADGSVCIRSVCTFPLLCEKFRQMAFSPPCKDTAVPSRKLTSQKNGSPPLIHTEAEKERWNRKRERKTRHLEASAHPNTNRGAKLIFGPQNKIMWDLDFARRNTELWNLWDLIQRKEETAF